MAGALENEGALQWARTRSAAMPEADASAHSQFSRHQDESARTAVSFSGGYIPELIEDQRERVRAFDMRMADAMIQYEELRAGLRELREKHGAELDRAQSTTVQGECCVCLDELGTEAEVTKTSCGHLFHCKCLVETLAGGLVKSCPTCRTHIKQLATDDLSGKVFRFICMVRINIDTVDSCITAIKREIEHEVGLCEVESRSLRKWRMLSALQRERRSVVTSKLLLLRTRLQFLEQFSQANIEGFEDIFKHVGDALSPGLAEACASYCANSIGFFRDGGTEGEYMRLAQRLSQVIRLTGVESARVLSHEEKLRAQRGLSAPSYSEAHFAQCNSFSRTSSVQSRAGADAAEADADAPKTGCFVSFLAPRPRRLSVAG